VGVAIVEDEEEVELEDKDGEVDEAEEEEQREAVPAKAMPWLSEMFRDGLA
jgi:hypothetical protein